MQIEVHGRHLDVTPPLRAYAERKAAGWSDFCRPRPGSTSSCGSSATRDRRAADRGAHGPRARGGAPRQGQRERHVRRHGPRHRPHEAQRGRVPRSPHNGRPPTPSGPDAPAEADESEEEDVEDGRATAAPMRPGPCPQHRDHGCPSCPCRTSARRLEGILRRNRGSSSSCWWSPTRRSRRGTSRRPPPGPPAPCCARGRARATSTRRSTWPPTGSSDASASTVSAGSAAARTTRRRREASRCPASCRSPSPMRRTTPRSSR